MDNKQGTVVIKCNSEVESKTFDRNESRAVTQFIEKWRIMRNYRKAKHLKPNQVFPEMKNKSFEKNPAL